MFVEPYAAPTELWASASGLYKDFAPAGADVGESTITNDTKRDQTTVLFFGF